jgi:signal transduction histidine kinase
MQTLRDLGTAGAQAQSVQEASQLCLEVLRANPADLPFALMYLLDVQGDTATLVGDSGSVADTALRPQHMVLTGTDAASASFWPLDKVLQGGEAIVDLPVQALPKQSSATPTPRQAVIVPLLPAGYDRPAGFLIVGVNARRTLNQAYLSFLRLVAGHISTALANATAHEAEQRRAEALAQLDRAKTAFFSNVSHEFRTPLTLMLGPLEDMLKRSAQGISIAQEELRLVHRNGLRLLRLVNTLLDFSRLEEGRAQAVYEPTDLALLTTERASVFRSAIERAGLQLSVDCPPLPQPVFVDRDMWEKIVFNLLSNAFKFTFAGEIAVTLHPRDTHVELSVRDTGTGIPADDFPHLFERFLACGKSGGAPMRARGLGWPWCRSWSSCTAAPCG